jgi:hypothetical protein
VKSLLVCLLSVGCVGCAGLDAMEPYPIKTNVDTVTIQLVRSPDAQIECRKAAGVSIGRHIEGCAIMSITHCTIYMLPAASNELLGHEARHCFDGAWHR